MQYNNENNIRPNHAMGWHSLKL